MIGFVVDSVQTGYTLALCGGVTQTHLCAFKHDICLISETKVHNTKDLGRFDPMNFSLSFRVPSKGKCNKIWLGWSDTIDIIVLASCERYIDVDIQDNTSGLWW